MNIGSYENEFERRTVYFCRDRADPRSRQRKAKELDDFLADRQQQRDYMAWQATQNDKTWYYVQNIIGVAVIIGVLGFLRWALLSGIGSAR